MKRFTIHFLILALLSGFYGFYGFDLWGTEAARVLFLIAADLFVVALFSRFLKNDGQYPQKVEA
ncbi:DUF1328 domain-containing protein [Leeuwenhoekiella sp. A16]|uniref:DUF1328 domain-containing protein n=1 Tax=unclassified Leeuwenhoekiella TaxID=2615029 RepID=UPI003A80E91A|tara:strand:- start:457 stop:648 length:192 start_codon:yes stop_codon:yes gene_type:complete